LTASANLVILLAMAAKKKTKKKTKKKAASANPKKKTKATPKKKKKKVSAKPRPKGPSADNAKAFLPGKLVKHDEGRFSLVFTDFVHDDVFEEQGLQGGGYTWHGLVDHVLKNDAPLALKLLDFDPEASMFAALSKDLWALHECAKALQKLQDKEVLRKIAKTVDLTEFD
jgi:hypothetical protein